MARSAGVRGASVVVRSEGHPDLDDVERNTYEGSRRTEAF
jgi:hypothetical protein